MTDDEIYESNIEAFAISLSAQILEQEDLRILAQLLGLQKQSGTEIEAMIDAILNSNLDKVKEYKDGKTKLIGFFVGQLMKQNKTADAKLANQLFTEKLSTWPTT